jgi:hypothetical protein
MNDEQIESEIQAKRLLAPRITREQVQSEIKSEFYFTAADAMCGQMAQHDAAGLKPGDRTYVAHADVPLHLEVITICVLLLRNGHRIVGVNAGPVSPENYDAELGRKLAAQNAIDQIWPLLGYMLREQLHTDETINPGA